MPWFCWFCFLTFPFLIGIGVTLAHPALNKPDFTWLVYCSALLWCGIAYKAYQHLHQEKARNAVSKWFLYTIAIPLAVLFAISLVFDPEIVELFTRSVQTNVEGRGPHMASTAPATHALTSRQILELWARVSPRLGRFLVKIFSGLPAIWWLAAFSIALWRGK